MEDLKKDGTDEDEYKMEGLTVATSLDGVADALSSSTFNPINFINMIFPTEQSLSQIDTVIQRVQLRKKQTDDEMFAAVRAQATAGSRGKVELESAKSAISQLFVKIQEIKKKATQSEINIQEICSEIRQLDHCKHNLTHTITALRRLQMLVTGVEQLSAMSENRQYPECAARLEAVIQLAEYFAAFRVPRVLAIKERLAGLRVALERTILEEFDRFCSHEQAPSEPQVQQMAGAAQCIEALGPECSWYAERVLLPYRSEFAPGREMGRLNRTEQRFAWLKNCVRSTEDRFGAIFPAGWCMAAHVAWEFCTLTNMEELRTERAESAQAARAKWRRIKRMQEREERRQKREGAISKVFVPYLSHFVSREEERLVKLVEQFGREPPVVLDDVEARTRVLESSATLFMAIKSALKRCQLLTDGQPLVDLGSAFLRALGAYADMLMGRLPRAVQNPAATPTRCASARPRRRCSATWSTPPPTASTGRRRWALQTAAQLVATIKRSLQEPLRESLTADPVQDRFTAIALGARGSPHAIPTHARSLLSTTRVTTAGVRGVVLLVQGKTDPILAGIPKIKWDAIESVGDETPFVGQLRATIAPALTPASRFLAPLYWKSFLDKFAGGFVGRYAVAVQKCRKFSFPGANQLHVDTQSVEALLLELPRALNNSATRSYTTIVQRGLGRVKATLKVITSPTEAMARTFRALFGGPEGFPCSVAPSGEGFFKSDRDLLAHILEMKARIDRIPPPVPAPRPSLPAESQPLGRRTRSP
ncbi:Vps53; component of GARP (Golgi-associated retrograde protein) and EARP (endosome-associated recycling protein) complexes [Paratrimastix pyriformis]|uniref:Vps53 n=1 Tax=Paratrimastix pyriformis TaxID=342808 RepID=A0ABQ8UMX6_9EUKA|nr:Vps53; component of GARP (Golgi-associated retrograde protein) and EARP (endosome-associated recycling protein) complexes [Paratrimastix pyriformis]